MDNPFRKKERKLNVLEEVGRDPLRIPRDTPPSQVLEVAAKLSAAKKVLRTVLPQPYRPYETDIPAGGWPDTFNPSIVEEALGYMPSDLPTYKELDHPTNESS